MKGVHNFYNVLNEALCIDYIALSVVLSMELILAWRQGPRGNKDWAIFVSNLTIVHSEYT